MTDNLCTQTTVNTTVPSTDDTTGTSARPARAWYDRAAGDLSSWGATYKPSSEAAALAWRAHREHVEPWVAATNPAGVTEARRVASAVLELLAWAMPVHNDLTACLTEEVLHQFLLANPNGLGGGALDNVRGRVRRVFRARAAAATATEVAPLAPVATATSVSAADAAKPARAHGVYDTETWAKLNQAAEHDPVLRAVIRPPWRRPTPAQWQHARAVAVDLGIELRQDRLRMTIWARAMATQSTPLGDLLSAHAISAKAATKLAPLLPAVDERSYARALRGQGQCARNPVEHFAGQISAARGAEDARTSVHAPGGAPVMRLF